MDQSIIFLFAAIIIVGGLLFAVIAMTRKGVGRLNIEHYRVKWLSIEQGLKRDEISSYHMAVLNADKLVDQALKEKGLKGETMGERMKNASSLLTKRNDFWTAHKLRNQIAHEPDVVVTFDSARRALVGFKQALKDLGAI